MRGLGIDNRLEAIAGKPAGMLTVPGNLTLGGFTQYGPRIFYAVVDFIGTPSAAWGFADLGSSPNGRITSGFGGAGHTSDLWLRAFPISGTDTTIGWIPTPAGRLAYTVGVSDGMTSAFFHRLGAAQTSVALTPAGGMSTAPIMNLGATHAGEVAPRIVVAYPAAHTVNQRTAIMAKLLQMVA